MRVLCAVFAVLLLFSLATPGKMGMRGVEKVGLTLVAGVWEPVPSPAFVPWVRGRWFISRRFGSGDQLPAAGSG